MDGWVNVMDGWVGVWMDGLMDIMDMMGGWMDGSTGRCIDGRWMDEQMGGWMGRWMNGSKKSVIPS